MVISSSSKCSPDNPVTRSLQTLQGLYSTSCNWSAEQLADKLRGRGVPEEQIARAQSEGLEFLMQDIA